MRILFTMNTTPDTHIGDALGFTHSDKCTQPNDDGLLYVERYIGETSRHIRSLDTETDDEGAHVVTIQTGDYTVDDEVVEGVRQWVECRYCDGTKVTVDDDVDVL